MDSKEKQLREMFYAEAFEAHEELNKLFTILEKKPSDKKSLDNIFRIVHTLKGNAMALGFSDIGELTHITEEMLVHVKKSPDKLDKDVFDLLYRSSDKLSELIDALKTENKVSYHGLVAKIEVYIDRYLADGETSGQVDESNTSENEESETIETVEEEIIEVDSEVDTKESNSVINQEAEQKNEPGEVPEIENESSSISTPVVAQPKTEPQEEETKINFSDQVQIPVRKLDSLMNLVGELIIEKDTLIARNGRSSDFKRLHRITSDMQYAIMDIRLVQVGLLFNKFHRIVRDVADLENKQVDLILEGNDIEIDRNILKTISDSMVHLVRNAVSHGIESDRTTSGKNAVGTLTLRAKNEKDTVLIEVEDDGKGIDPNIIKNKAIEKGIITKEYAQSLSDQEATYLIFESGFSNADKVTEISGRGVGMDVVKRATESVGGQVVIESKPGKGTKFTLKLPSSMAVKGALLFEQNQQEFAVPLTFTEAVISIKATEIHKISKGLMTNYQDQTMVLVFLRDLFELPDVRYINSDGALHQTFDQIDKSTQINVIVVNYNEKYVGIVVDKLLQQKEIVEKPLAKPLDQVDLFTGATILGNGSVCMVLNIASILEGLFSDRKSLKIELAEAS